MLINEGSMEPSRLVDCRRVNCTRPGDRTTDQAIYQTPLNPGLMSIDSMLVKAYYSLIEAC